MDEAVSKAPGFIQDDAAVAESDDQRLATPPSAWEEFLHNASAMVRRKAKKIKCGGPCLKRNVLSWFPILSWLGNYNIKRSLMGDVVAGLTVGVLNIPQGMAYAVLAQVEPVNGLYTSFFPVLMYTIFCTSRHAAVGTFSILSLMTGEAVLSIGRELYGYDKGLIDAHGNETDKTTEGLPPDVRLQIVQALTLGVGFWTLLMGILRLGYLSVLLSDHLIKGFTCAAAFHVLTVQLKLVLGMKLPDRQGAFKLLYIYYDVFVHISNVHVPTLIVSLVCIVVLYIIRTFINQNPKIMRIIRIPVPTELLVIVFGTVVSYYMELDAVWKVRTVRNIPTGLPHPQTPGFSMVAAVLPHSLSLAVIVATVLISLGKIFASKHHYKLDPNQELFAIGFANIFGAFFMCVPATGALARSTVQEAVHGSTQLVSIISAAVLLVVMLALGRFLQPLPRACLGSIIIVSLINLLKQVTHLEYLCKLSLIDASIFFVTMMATLLFDVELGLAVGVLYSLVTFAFRLQFGKLEISNSDVVTGDLSGRSFMNTPTPGVEIVKLYGPLYSGNADTFVSNVVGRIEETRPSLEVVNGDVVAKGSHQKDPEEQIGPSQPLNGDALTHQIRTIVVDCSAMTFVDVVGVEALKKLTRICQKQQVDVFFAGCSSDVRDMLLRAELHKLVPVKNFTANVNEALLLASD